MPQPSKFSLYEEYLFSASITLERAMEAEAEGNTEDALLYFRSCVFFTAGAMEAFLNWIADAFEVSDTLSTYETDFLCDRARRIDPKTGKAEPRVEYQRTEDKLRFLVSRFAIPDVISSDAWSEFKAFKKFRDEIVHPRDGQSEQSLTRYRNACRKGISGTILLLNALSNGIFRKGLRKKILDIIAT